MRQNRPPFWRRHRGLAIVMGVMLGLLIVAGAGLAVIAHRFEPFLRASLVQGLQDRFHTRVELDEFHVALGNGLEGEWGIWATGRGLRIWPPHRTGGDHPLETAVQSIPLISLGEFRFHVPLRYRSGRPITISRIRLTALKIVVPPPSERDKATGFESAFSQAGSPAGGPARAPSRKASRPTAPDGAGPDRTGPNPAAAPALPTPDSSQGGGMLSSVLVKRIDCDHAQLILETNKPDRLPMEFDITRLRLTDVSADRPMDFAAQLTIPKPQGIINTTGRLGPWQVPDPSETQLSGAYSFDHADLAAFKGIAGILASTGNYAGTLRDIVVDGKADVPDFRLTHFGNAMPLHTQFHAKVDGTDGDTWLDSVDATLGHSHFTTRGAVVRTKPLGMDPMQAASVTSPPPQAAFGHHIDLKVNVDQGHIEDFLRLAGRSSAPILSGTLSVEASLQIPPGTRPVHERMRLDGSFKLDQARFTDAKIQQRIADLSLRGEGHPGEIKTTDAITIASEMQGDFHMANATIALPNIQYSVPGAAIRLEGRYALEGSIDFQGTARMQATVSQMVGGWKGFLLRPVDRFFKKDGAGTQIPIQIRGPHDAPQFSIDFSHMKKTSPETPGQKQ